MAGRTFFGSIVSQLQVEERPQDRRIEVRGRRRGEKGRGFGLHVCRGDVDYGSDGDDQDDDDGYGMIGF